MKKQRLTYSFLLKVCALMLLLCMGPLGSYAQSEKSLLRAGNSKYEKGKYNDAVKNYQQSLKEKPDYLKAEYNLGNAFYKQKKYNDAAQQFENVVRGTNNKDTLCKAFHNLGNAYLKQKNYESAVSAYKNSLKINSRDDSTRYNLAYAMRKLQQQQQQQKQQQNQDNKDQKQNQENKDQKKEEDKKDQDKQQQQQVQMSKEEAQRMLDALKNNEKRIAGKRKIKGDKYDRTNPEKDW